MNDALVPCSVCARHVRASCTECPFCHAAHTPVVVAARPNLRLSRAAAFAFGASLTLSGCSSQALYGAPAPPPDVTDSSTPPQDVAADSGSPDATPADTAPADTAPADTFTPDIAAMYGGPPPPPDAGPADVIDDATPADAGGVRYGAPPPPDWC